MSLKKISFTFTSSDAEPLNSPKGGLWDIMNTEPLIKTASLDKTKQVDLGGFDIESAVKEHPEHLFVKVFAIKKDEVNDNGDSFGEAELKKSAHTFIGVPVFVNHQNDDVEKARGKVVHAWYDDAAGGIYTINAVDATAYPKLARGIREKFITGTSMGASVGASCCSVCHRLASDASEFCSHVKERKGKRFNGKMACKYHESPSNPTGECRVCGCKQGESKEHIYKEAQIYEHNYDIKFIEDSFVVSPACHDCLVCDVFNAENFDIRIAALKDKVHKVTQASSTGMLKVAGQNEITELNDAMGKLERVARSMMAQKQKVQLEYVSDIVDALASIQSITDELVEMGYAQLPSPSEQEITLGNNTPASPSGQQGAQQMSPNQMPPAGNSQMGGMSGQMPMQSAPVGSVTKPSFSASASKEKKEFFKEAQNISSRLQDIHAQLRSFVDNFVTETARLEKLNTVYASEPHTLADSVLTKLVKESEVKMASQEKTAAGTDKSQIEVTTEAQLQNNKMPILGRQENPPEGITESKEQLGGSPKRVDVTLDSPQTRRGSYETITEDQLKDITSGYMLRWNDYPEITTEGQWDDISRAVRAALPDDWTESISQAQLISLRDKHSWVDPDFITERQLAEQEGTVGNKETARYASKGFDAKTLVKQAMAAVVDAIANYNVSPQDISRAVANMTSNPQSQIRAARMVLLNSIPRTIEARKAERSRRNYFAKIAGTNEAFQPIDAVIASIADNVKYASSIDLVDIVRIFVNDKQAMKKAEQSAIEKIASRQNGDADVVESKESLFRKAFAELDRPEDGTYKIIGTIADDIKVSPNDRNKFLSTVDKFARSQVEAETVLTNVEVDTEAGTFEAIIKEAGVLSPEEKKAKNVLDNVKVAWCPPWKDECKDKDGEEEESDGEEKKASRVAARDTMVKQAQMMGGQMGGGMGGGAGAPGGAPGQPGGQGATMPTPPGGEQPPVESFSAPGEEPFGEEDTGSEPKPPGSVCPVCASENVDVVAGKGKCNDCNSEFVFKVDIEVTKWSGMLDNGDEDGPGADISGEEGMGDEMGGEGEGFELPDNESGSMPVAAMTRLTPNALKKMAEKGIKLGSVSPITGSTNTMEIGKNEYVCLDTGNKYSIHFAYSNKDKKKLFAEWRWNPKTAQTECSSCRMAKKNFLKSLASFGLTESQFDAAKAIDKAKIVIAMQEKGLLKQTKIASKRGNVIDEVKTAFSVSADKFPIEGCREKLARRYGQNSVALSGPCEGKNLADCVCDKMKTAGFYSHGLATKIASIWSDQDGTVECWEDFVRSGLNAKQASTVCEQIRRKYSMAEHFLADAMTDTDAMNKYALDFIFPSSGTSGGGVGGGMGGGMPAGPTPGGMGGDDEFSDDGALDDGVDPFAADQGAGGDTVQVDLPMSVLEALKNVNEQLISAIQGNGGGELGGAPEVGGDASLMGDVGSEPMAGGDSMGGEISGDLGGVETGSDIAGTEMPGDVGGDIGGDIGGELGGDAEIPGEAGIGGDPASIEVEMGGDAGGDIGGEIGGDVGGEVGQIADKALDTADNMIEEVKEEIPGIEGEGHEEGNPAEGEAGDTGKPEDTDSDSDDESDSDEGGESEGSDGAPDFLEKEGEEARFAEAKDLRRGRIVGNHKVALDVSSIVTALNLRKKAGEESLSQHNAQDDPDIGKIQGDSTIGKEDKFTAAKPDVPAKGSAATMGHESKDLHPGKEGPKVFTGDANMGHESEQGYKSEKTNQNTGGDKGAGHKANSTKRRISDLADRIKSASEKKLDTAKPDSEDKDIGTFSDNKDLSTTSEGNKIQPFAEGDKKHVNNVPEKGDGAFMGHEKDTINSVPKADKDAPSIPAGGGKNPKYDTKWDAEKQTAHKGTAIANDVKSQVARKEAATKLAGRMIEKGLIKSDQLMAKIAEIERYEIPQIADLEKAMFVKAATAQKGLTAVSSGSEKAVVISESSLYQKPENELKSKLQQMFKLHRMNELADNDPDSQLRR